MADEVDGKKVAQGAVGCAGAAWSLFVTLPLWFVILFGVLLTIDAPQWLWLCFYVYIPACAIGSIAIGLFHLFSKG